MTDDGTATGDFDEEEDFDPEEAERQIAEFIATADELEGPAIADLADAVARVLDGTWSAIEEIIGPQTNNKVIATMLLLSSQARQLQPEDARHWQLHAASSLVGAMIPNARHP